MKSVIAAVVTCVLLFGISLGATYFLAPAPSPETDATGENSESEASAGEEDSLQDMVRMPVSFRPDPAVSVEAVLQMSDSIKETEQQLLKREEEINKREKQLALLFEDLQIEQDELRAFSEGIDAKVEMMTRLANDLQANLDAMETQKQELEKLTKEAGQDEASQQAEMENKVNDVKGWFEGLAPGQAADYLKEFANNGHMEFAASLLQKMPDRQKSKILGVMSDPLLVDQLIQALNTKPKQP